MGSYRSVYVLLKNYILRSCLRLRIIVLLCCLRCVLYVGLLSLSCLVLIRHFLFFLVLVMYYYVYTQGPLLNKPVYRVYIGALISLISHIIVSNDICLLNKVNWIEKLHWCTHTLHFLPSGDVSSYSSPSLNVTLKFLKVDSEENVMESPSLEMVMVGLVTPPTFRRAMLTPVWGLNM